MSDLPFPLGIEIANGRWTITAALHGTLDRGLFRVEGEAPGVATIGTVQVGGCLEFARTLTWDSPGIVPILWAGTVTVDGVPQDVLIEAEPAGVSLARWSGDNGARLCVAHGLAEVVRAAHERGIVLECVRPEVVYVNGASLSGILPRTLRFQANMRAPCYGVPQCFEELYFSPSQAFVREHGRPDDVFLLGATLAFLFTGQYPFPGDSTMTQLAAIMAATHHPLERAGVMAPLLGAMMDIEPNRRPSIGEVCEQLGAARG